MTDVSEAQEHDQETSQEIPPEEVKARDMGWRPEEDWSGDKDRWMPADEFVARNDRLKARADNIAKAENAKLTRKVSELTQVVDDLKGHMSRAEQGAYKRALAEIKAEQRQAVDDGDTAAFDVAAKKVDDLEKEAAAKAAEKPKAAPNPDEEPEYVEWLADNSWYDPKSDDLDLEMRAFANQVGDAAGPMGLSGRALYERVTKEVKKKFPERFGNPKRRNAAAVEGGGTGGGSRGAKKGYTDLPADAKAVCDRLVKEKLYDRPSKDMKLSDKEARERYANDYFESEE